MRCSELPPRSRPMRSLRPHLSARRAWAAPAPAVAELGVVRRCYAHSLIHDNGRHAPRASEVGVLLLLRFCAGAFLASGGFVSGYFRRCLHIHLHAADSSLVAPCSRYSRSRRDSSACLPFASSGHLRHQFSSYRVLFGSLLGRPRIRGRLCFTSEVRSTMTATPNHALQRTAPVGHAACSPQSPPRRHRARPPRSLSLGSFGDFTRASLHRNPICHH
jgi:hypothetical protein